MKPPPPPQRVKETMFRLAQGVPPGEARDALLTAAVGASVAENTRVVMARGRPVVVTVRIGEHPPPSQRPTVRR